MVYYYSNTYIVYLNGIQTYAHTHTVIWLLCFRTRSLYFPKCPYSHVRSVYVISSIYGSILYIYSYTEKCAAYMGIYSVISNYNSGLRYRRTRYRNCAPSTTKYLSILSRSLPPSLSVSSSFLRCLYTLLCVSMCTMKYTNVL